MKRTVITIDHDKCNGCGLCIPGCPEGAIKIIDGKARLVSDLLCDGLGACLGRCPENAISVEEREAEDYDERKVMANIAVQGANTIGAHLAHLEAHGQSAYLAQAMAYLKENGIPIPAQAKPPGCPGSRATAFEQTQHPAPAGGDESQLTHWPIQLRLVSPRAAHYRGCDLLLAADCTAFASGAFHGVYLKGRKLAIACPKLDGNQDVYVEKITALIDDAGIKSLTVLIMPVPCCEGLLRMAQKAAAQAARKIHINCLVVGIDGTARASSGSEV